MESRDDLAEALPRVYRAALDAVDELSQLGLRREASQLRDRAIRAYSHAWDERCLATLTQVRHEAVAASISVAARLGRPLPGSRLPG